MRGGSKMEHPSSWLLGKSPTFHFPFIPLENGRKQHQRQYLPILCVELQRVSKTDTLSRLVLVFATSTPIWGSGSNQETQLVVVLYEETEESWGRKSRPQVRIKLQNNYYSVFLNKRMTPQNAESSVHWADNTIITHEESPLFHCYDFARGNQLCNVRTWCGRGTSRHIKQ